MEKGAVILVEDLKNEGNFLFLEQTREEYETEDHYAPPAGTYDTKKDNNIYDTAVRELHEETGISVEKNDLDLLFETEASYGVDKLEWYHVRIEIIESDLDFNHESSGYRMMTIEEALNENLLDDTRLALKQLIE